MGRAPKAHRRPALASSDGHVRLVSLGQPNKCCFPQANRVTLTKSCRYNNSSGDDFAHQFGLVGGVKRFAGSIESFAHHRNRFRIERSGFYE